MAEPVWVIDTSALIELSSSAFARENRARGQQALLELAAVGRAVFPMHVVKELRRYEGSRNPALDFATSLEGLASRDTDYGIVAEVLAQVPEVLDYTKEAGAEEADPYVLAVAVEMRRRGVDARICHEEFKTRGAKMDMGSASGYLGVPSLSVRALLKFVGAVVF